MRDIKIYINNDSNEGSLLLFIEFNTIKEFIDEVNSIQENLIDYGVLWTNTSISIVNDGSFTKSQSNKFDKIGWDLTWE